MEEKSKLDQEITMIKENTNKNILELKNFSSFFNIFSSIFQEQIKSLNDKISLYQEQNSSMANQSLLSTNLNSIVDIFKQFNNNSKNLLNKIQNELINTLEVFTNNQINIYQENNDALKELYLSQNNNNKLLYNSKYNYYRTFYIAKKEEIDQEKKGNQKISINEEEKDILIKDKMEAKNNEMIYKYELNKYNKQLEVIEDNYTKIKNKMELAEQSRISFIKASFDKYKRFWNNYSKIINEYTDTIGILFSDDICNKIQQENIKEISKFTGNTKQLILSSKQDYMSYNEFCEKSDPKKKDKNNLIPINFNFNKNVKIEILDNEQEKNIFYNKLINELLGRSTKSKNSTINRIIPISKRK